MKKSLYLIFAILILFIGSENIHCHNLEVFSIVRHYISEHELNSKLKKKVHEFSGSREFLRFDDQLNDSILSLTMPSDIYYSEFYISKWDDSFNLLIERCIGTKDCNQFVIHHYSKYVKGLYSKHLNEKYVKVEFDNYRMGIGECADLFRVTIEKEELEEIPYNDGYAPEGETRYKEKKSIVKSFYVYFCD